MMKLKIKIAFVDKYTGDNYSVGDVIDFKESRAKELLSDKRGLVEAIVVKEEKPKATTKKK